MVGALITKNVSVTLRKIMNIKSHMLANKQRLVISTIFGVIAGTLIMYASWQHNSQCEIHCEGVVYWGYWFMLGAFVFVPVFVFVYGLVWIISYVQNT